MPTVSSQGVRFQARKIPGFDSFVTVHSGVPTPPGDEQIGDVHLSVIHLNLALEFHLANRVFSPSSLYLRWAVAQEGAVGGSMGLGLRIEARGGMNPRAMGITQYC